MFAERTTTMARKCSRSEQRLFLLLPVGTLFASSVKGNENAAMTDRFSSPGPQRARLARQWNMTA